MWAMFLSAVVLCSGLMCNSVLFQIGVFHNRIFGFVLIPELIRNNVAEGLGRNSSLPDLHRMKTDRCLASWLVVFN